MEIYKTLFSYWMFILVYEPNQILTSRWSMRSSYNLSKNIRSVPERSYSVTHLFHENGSLKKTLVLPESIDSITGQTDRSVRSFSHSIPYKHFEGYYGGVDSDLTSFMDDGFVLVSNSSRDSATEMGIQESFANQPRRDEFGNTSSFSKSASNMVTANNQNWGESSKVGMRKGTIIRVKKRRRKKKPPNQSAMQGTQSLMQGNVTEEMADAGKIGKFLNLFTLVRFANDACMTDGLRPEGTCYHQSECKSLGGTVMGPCAQGYGVCCLLEQSCGERTSINRTVFVGGSTNPCTLTIDKAYPNIQQIRLDFLRFELSAPSNGSCMNDQFIVAGQNINSIVPVLCGVNSGQHVYVDVSDSAGPITLSLVSLRSNSQLHVRITQLHGFAAPPNCLQYHTGLRGSLQSFNYPSPSGYLKNLNYVICIRKEQGYCSIFYSNVSPNGTEYPFELNNIDPDGALSVPPGQAGAEIFDCPDDYIVVGSIRLCGQKFNDGSVDVDFRHNYPVADNSNGPIIITVRSNANDTGRGFKVDYDQTPCKIKLDMP